MSIDAAVLERYSQGAATRQEDLCCPIHYDEEQLKNLPTEIIEKDYGCGDPSRYVKQGDTVLDLGSGSGKIAYISAGLVGTHGKVIGVDMNDDMLALARKYQSEMADKLGGDRVCFVKGRIQDLALDIDAMDAWLKENPLCDHEGLEKLHNWKSEQSKNHPLIPDNSIDLVISNCVLNLVADDQKEQLVQAIFRVVKPGGRIAISDIVSDKFIPSHLKEDDALWSGCLSGAFQEHEMLNRFAEYFHAVSYDQWSAKPWRVVDGIEFRSVTLTATKPHGTEYSDKGHAVIYKGPFKQVTDDEGHIFDRGKRTAVCERMYHFCTEGPYRKSFIGIEPADQQEAKRLCGPSNKACTAKESIDGSHKHTGSKSCC